jgi:oxalate decarboxylase/phosphoglucose isomerase-like protein (cupin superfamily)
LFIYALARAGFKKENPYMCKYLRIQEGWAQEFGPGDTLIVPSDAVHQVTCSGSEPLSLVAALGAAPVRVHDAEKQRIPLPWDAPDP